MFSSSLEVSLVTLRVLGLCVVSSMLGRSVISGSVVWPLVPLFACVLCVGGVVFSVVWFVLTVGNVFFGCVLGGGGLCSYRCCRLGLQPSWGFGVV